jgi:hypothetical protein
LHNDERIQEYLTKLFNNNNSDPGFSYGTVLNSQRYTIHSGINQPCQFSLGNIPTMSSITNCIGEGWDTKDFKIFQQTKQHCKSTRRGSHDYIKTI